MGALAPVRARRDESFLLVVDVQERLVPHIADHAALVARVQALIDAAELFGIPKRLTEHCPDELGPVIGAVRDRFTADEILVKKHFGTLDHAELAESLRLLRRECAVVAGMEAHVCVMQTVLGLREHGFAVVAVADAIGARGPRAVDRTLALERMRAAGTTLAGTETLLFEWTERGDDPRFRDVLRRVKSLP